MSPMLGRTSRKLPKPLTQPNLSLKVVDWIAICVQFVPSPRAYSFDLGDPVSGTDHINLNEGILGGDELR